MPDPQTTASYTLTLCGDCPSGPPCRCSDDPAEVNRVWSSGRWAFVATCAPKEETNAN